MKSLKYICSLLYILFVLQGIYTPEDLFTAWNVQGEYFSNSECANVQTSSNGGQADILLFLTDDDDDDDQRRRLMLPGYLSIHQPIALYHNHLFNNSEVEYSPAISLFFTDASPPVFV